MIKELEDYNWFPQLFRHFQTAYIGSIIKWTKFYKPLVPVVQHLLNENKINNIQDLCSGSGMPAVFMQQQLSGDYKTTLSDKFPVSLAKNGQPPPCRAGARRQSRRQRAPIPPGLTPSQDSSR